MKTRILPLVAGAAAVMLGIEARGQILGGPGTNRVTNVEVTRDADKVVLVPSSGFTFPRSPRSEVIVTGGAPVNVLTGIAVSPNPVFNAGGGTPVFDPARIARPPSGSAPFDPSRATPAPFGTPAYDPARGRLPYDPGRAMPAPSGRPAFDPARTTPPSTGRPAYDPARGAPLPPLNTTPGVPRR